MKTPVASYWRPSLKDTAADEGRVTSVATGRPKLQIFGQEGT